MKGKIRYSYCLDENKNLVHISGARRDGARRDRSRVRANNKRSITYSVLVGTGVALFFDILFQLVRELRNVNRRKQEEERKGAEGQNAQLYKLNRIVKHNIIMNMKKLSLLFLMMLLTVVAHADSPHKKGDTFVANNITYKVININPLEVQVGSGAKTCIDKKTEGAFVVPNSVTGADGKRYVVKAIGNDAFGGCVNLTNITIPNSVKVIDTFSFSGCSSLTHITIPNSVTTIGYCAFDGCSQIESITIPNSVVEIGEAAFKFCSKLKNINLPPGLKTIGKGAFYECKSLSSIVIPDGVTSLDGVFDHCPALKTIVLPKGLNHLNGTFKFCTFLSHIDIPSSVRYLGRMSFQNCSALETITIPSSVKRINRGAFWDCKNLKTVKVYPQTEIEDNIFTNCPNAKIVKINSVVQTTTPNKKPIVDNKPSVEFSKIWLEHGAEENGQKGMKVHMNMTSHNLKGQKFTTTAYIDRPKYQGIKAKDNRYRLSNGNVAVTRDFTPTWDNTNYNDCTLFFPYSSFEIGPGKNTYYCRVFAFYNGSSIGNSQFESFDGTGPIASASENSNNGRNSTELKSITLNGSEMVGKIWGVLANPNERTMLNDVLQALRSRFPQSDFVEYKYGHFSDIRFNNFSMQWKDYQVEPSASFKKEKLSHYYYVIRFDRNKFKLHQVVELAHQFKREVEAGLPDMHLEDLNSSNIKGSVKYSTSYIDHKNRKISVSISVSEDITNFTLSIFIFPTSN